MFAAPNPNITPIDLPDKPWHRLAASLFATGTPIHDITITVGQPVAAISSFLTSRRGSELIRNVLSENKARLDDLLDAAAVDSLMTLIKIRDTSDSDSARIAASRELLSKTLPGLKARDAKTLKTGSRADNPEDEIARLKAKVAQV
jgi:hypothetical protein